MAGAHDGAAIRIEDFHAFESSDLFRRTVALAVAEIRTQAAGWRRIGEALAAERDLLARALGAIDPAEFRGALPEKARQSHRRLDDRLSALIDGVAAPAAALEELAAGVALAAKQAAGARVGYGELNRVAGGFTAAEAPHPAPFLEASYRPAALAAAVPAPLPGLDRASAPAGAVTATPGPAEIIGPGPGATGPSGSASPATVAAAATAPAAPATGPVGPGGLGGLGTGAGAGSGATPTSPAAASPAPVAATGAPAAAGAPGSSVTGARGGTGPAAASVPGMGDSAAPRPAPAGRTGTTGPFRAAPPSGRAAGPAGGAPRGGTADRSGPFRSSGAGTGSAPRPPAAGAGTGSGAGSGPTGAGRPPGAESGTGGLRRAPGAGAVMPLGAARGMNRGAGDDEELPAEYLTSADNGEQIVGPLARVVLPVLGEWSVPD